MKGLDNYTFIIVNQENLKAMKNKIIMAKEKSEYLDIQCSLKLT